MEIEVVFVVVPVVRDIVLYRRSRLAQASPAPVLDVYSIRYVLYTSVLVHNQYQVGTPSARLRRNMELRLDRVFANCRLRTYTPDFIRNRPLS